MKYVFNPMTSELDAVSNDGGSSVQITVSLTKSVANLVEFTGNGIANILTWKVLKNGAASIPKSVSIVKKEGSGSETLLVDIEQPSSNTGTIDAPVSYKGTTTFTARFYAGGQNKTASASVTSILPIFMGFGDNTSDLMTLISQNNLVKYVKTDFNGELLNLNNPEEGNRLIIAIPENKTLTEILSGPFPVPMQEVKLDKRTLNGVDYNYKVYRNYHPVEAGIMPNLKITII